MHGTEREKSTYKPTFQRPRGQKITLSMSHAKVEGGRLVIKRLISAAK